MMDIDNVEVQQDQDSIAEQKENQENQSWTLFIDGSSTIDRLGVGIVFKSLKRMIIE